MNTPEPGWAGDVTVSRIIDGDTVEVTLTRTFNVRLNNINAPELNTEKGLKGKEYLEGWIKGKTVRLFVPSHRAEKLIDFLSFERVLGRLFMGNTDVGERLKEKGYATCPKN